MLQWMIELMLIEILIPILIPILILIAWGHVKFQEALYYYQINFHMHKFQLP